MLGWASRAPTASPGSVEGSVEGSFGLLGVRCSDSRYCIPSVCVSRSLRLASSWGEDQDAFFAGTGYSQVPSGSPGDVACPCIDPFNVAFNYFKVTNPFARCFAETAERVGLNERARTTSRAIERVSEVVPSRTGYWRSELYIL